MQHQPLYSYLKEYAKGDPDKRLLGDGQGWLTASQVLDRVNETAGKLYGLGLRSGDWIAMKIDQNADSIINLMSLLAIGCVVPLTNARTPVRQALADAQFVKHMDYTLSCETGQWLLEKNGETHPLAQAPSGEFVLSMDSLAPAVVIFTSGSTGKSKGVILSQNGLICNMWAINIVGGYRKSDIALGALPMDHVFGLIMLFGAVLLRHALYLTTGSDLKTVVQTIQEQKITRMNGVTALYLNMAAVKADYDLTSLRIGFIGGGPCTAAQFEKIEDELGMTLISGYGMSECMGITANDWRAPREKRSGSVGPFYTVNESVLLDANGRECAPGETGEVCTRGPQLMIGYCDEEMNRAAFDENGFFHTSDLGYLDEDGYLHLTGRTRDIIIRNGVNLPTRRIEEAILDIPGVDDAMVVGLADEKQGEVPYAMVKGSLTAEAILAHLATTLPKNEIPAGIMVANVLPYNPNGKPDKLKGKEMLTAWVKA